MKSKITGKLKSDSSMGKEDMLSIRKKPAEKVKRNRKPSIYDEMDDEFILDNDFNEEDLDSGDEDDDY